MAHVLIPYDLPRSESYHPWDLLYVACLHGHTEIVQDILDNQKNRGDMEVDKVTKYGFTAMEIAALNGRTEIVRLLRKVSPFHVH